MAAPYLPTLLANVLGDGLGGVVHRLNEVRGELNGGLALAHERLELDHVELRAGVDVVDLTVDVLDDSRNLGRRNRLVRAAFTVRSQRGPFLVQHRGEIGALLLELGQLVAERVWVSAIPGAYDLV